ncbi:O-antigen ligase family protein [Bdellovibrio sp. GT3]|uniref:O-antigen ligase family protein n=1 Tax=Bdellovibrio sp. GT3 TaxID=3136282 RepID=UPI0030EFB066
MSERHKSTIVSILVVSCIGAALVSWRIFDALIVIFALVMMSFYTKDMRKWIREKRFSGPGKFTNWLIPIWLIAVTLSYATQQSFGQDQLDDILSFRWMLALFLFVWAGTKITFSKRFLTSVFSSICIFLIAGLLWQFIILPTISPSVQLDTRFIGFFHNANHYGLAVGILFSFTAGILTLSIVQNASIRTSAAALLISGICTFGSQTRSSWLGIGLAILFILIIFKRNKRITYPLIACAVVTTLVFAFDIGPLKSRLLYAFDSSGTSSTGIRMDLWKANIQIFKEHWIFGAGYYENIRLLPEYFKKLNINQTFIGHAHNQYLQVLAGTGIVGFVVYLAFFAKYLRFFWLKFTQLKDTNSMQISFASILVLITFLAQSLTECPFNLREPRSIMIILLGTTYGYLSKLSPES